MGRRAVRSEAKGNVETRFTHGAIPFIIVRAEPHDMFRPALRSGHARSNVARLNGVTQSVGVAGLPLLLFDKVVVGLVGVNHEVAYYVAIEASFILQAFGGRSDAKIVITG